MWECSCSSGILLRAEQSILNFPHAMPYQAWHGVVAQVSSFCKSNAATRRGHAKRDALRSAALAALLAIGSFAGPASHRDSKTSRSPSALPASALQGPTDQCGACSGGLLFPPPAPQHTAMCDLALLSRSRIHATRMLSKPWQSPAVMKTEMLKWNASRHSSISQHFRCSNFVATWPWPEVSGAN